MINRIERLENIGKFKSFECDEHVQDFCKLNMIFGYNGTGKTTLSNVIRLYSSLENEEQCETLFQYLSHNRDDAKATITINGKKEKYTRNCPKEEIYVFNSNFIGEHVYEGENLEFKSFDGSVVTKEQLRNPEIKKLEEQIKNKTEEVNKESKYIEKIETQFENIKSRLSSEFNNKVKGSRMPSITLPNQPPKNTYKDNREKLNEEYRKYKLSTKQNDLNSDIEQLKGNIPLKIQIDMNDLQEKLSTNISIKAREKVQNKIDRLKDYQPKKYTLNEWFEEGYGLLKKLRISESSYTLYCPLCNTSIGEKIEQLLGEYNEYFSEEYKKLSQEIENYKETIEKGKEIIKKNQTAISILSNIESKYSDQQAEITKAKQFDNRNILNSLGKIELALQAKLNNIENKFIIENEDTDNVKKYNEFILNEEKRNRELTELLKSYSINPEEVLRGVRELIKECAIAELNESFEGNQINNYKNLNESLKTLNNEISKISDDKNNEMAKLRDESKYVNNYLEKLRITNFKIIIETDDNKKNINIQYNDGNIHTKLRCSLSESEKTALAFAYFLSKIRYEVIENPKRELSDIIIVIDDPISSLDENHLHITACLISLTFKEAKQVFIFSHNIAFMRYMNNVVDNSHRRDYYLCNINEEIKELPYQLRNYKTTYFQKLNEIINYNEGITEYEDVKSFLPIYIRTTLETFLSFKLSLLHQGSSNDKYRSAGLTRLINCFIKYNKCIQNFNKYGSIDHENIFEVLENIKNTTDPQVHGSPYDIDAVSYVSEKELKDITQNTLDLIGFIDQIHLERVKSAN